MIFAIIGGVGSGKSVSAVRRVVRSKAHCFCNFHVDSPNCTRLKKEDIVSETIKEVKKNGKVIKEYHVNWDFWNEAKEKYGEFHLFLDEVHNLFHSRQSMTKWNTLGSMWISQIRKILGQSERTHIFLISQRISGIDVAFRDLMHGVIYCMKYTGKDSVPTKVKVKGKRRTLKIPECYIVQFYFNSVEDFQKFHIGGFKTYINRNYFRANDYFQFYDTHEVFGESAYL